jgi:thymidylate synthase
LISRKHTQLLRAFGAAPVCCQQGLSLSICVSAAGEMWLQVCHLKPGELVHVLGDAHVYTNHVEPLKQQLLNAPCHFPRLVLNPEKLSIDDFVADDFTLLDYQPHKTIKMQMAV